MSRSVSHRPLIRLHAPLGFGRLVRACLLAILFLTLNVGGMSASVGWCRSDPVLQINNALADVFVSIPIEDVTKVTGPTQFVITTPVGIDEAVLLTSPGFGYGETVTFKESRALKVTTSGIQLRIAVYLPATDNTVPVLVEFAPRVIGILAPTSVTGTTNQWIVFETHL
jgi:hypothetical protein